MPKYEYHMQKDMKFQARVKEYLEEMPYFCSVFVNGIEGYNNSNTIHSYVHRISVFFKFLESECLLPAGKQIKDLDYSDLDNYDAVTIENFTHWLRTGGAQVVRIKSRLKESTINNYISALSALWHYGVTHGFVKHNSIKDIRRGKTVKKEVVYLDPEQSDTFLQAAAIGKSISKHQESYKTQFSITRDLAILTLFLHTGLRVSELVGINIEDIFFDNHFVQVLRKEGKEDNVYFSDDAEQVLKEYLEVRPLAEPVPGEKALFLSERGVNKGKRISVRSIERMVKHYAQLSVPEKGSEFTVHKLRATFASQMIEKTDLSLVQQLLFHESPSTTSLYVAKRTQAKKEHRNDLM